MKLVTASDRPTVDVKDIAGRRDPGTEGTVRGNVRIDLSIGVREDTLPAAYSSIAANTNR